MAGKKGFPEFEFKLPNFDMAFWDKFKDSLRVWARTCLESQLARLKICGSE